MNEKKHKPVLLLSDSLGIYIPRDFVNAFDAEKWHISAENIADLSDPNNEYYWDAWDNVLDNAYCHHAGVCWRLWQEGDLWAIPEGFDMEKKGWIL